MFLSGTEWVRRFTSDKTWNWADACTWSVVLIVWLRTLIVIYFSKLIRSGVVVTLSYILQQIKKHAPKDVALFKSSFEEILWH